MSTLRIIVGPKTSSVTKEEAEAKLLKNPQYPKHAKHVLEEVNGHWVAAISSSDRPEKQASPLPFENESDEPKADDAPELEADNDPSEPEAPEGEPEAENEPKEKDHSEKDDSSSEKKELNDLKQLIEKIDLIMGALGISPEALAENPAHEGEEPGGEKDYHKFPADGAYSEGPEGSDGKHHVVHERALKPGEAAPGQTPVGAPAFSSTNKFANHPWKKAIESNAASFTVEEPIGEATLASIHKELQNIANGTGYTVSQIVEVADAENKKVARALIAKVKNDK